MNGFASIGVTVRQVTRGRAALSMVFLLMAGVTVQVPRFIHETQGGSLNRKGWHWHKVSLVDQVVGTLPTCDRVPSDNYVDKSMITPIDL